VSIIPLAASAANLQRDFSLKLKGAVITGDRHHRCLLASSGGPPEAIPAKYAMN
jgi:hypothetical protein